VHIMRSRIFLLNCIREQVRTTLRITVRLLRGGKPRANQRIEWVLHSRWTGGYAFVRRSMSAWVVVFGRYQTTVSCRHIWKLRGHFRSTV